MHVFIQIPCFNEEKSISKVLKNLPKNLKGATKIKIILLDDGSTDNTVSIVRRNFPYVKIISNSCNLGLAETFKRGIDYALSNKADIIVNIDGDNQYKGTDIERLIKPIILENSYGGGGADYTIGERQFKNLKSFSLIKKFLHYSGNLFLKKVTGIKTNDVTSGFRAFNRNSASKIFYTNNFTYTIESLFFFSDFKLSFKAIKIKTNKPERQSRLFKNNFEYIIKTAFIIIKVLMMKKPFQIFSFISLIFFVSGFLFCYDWYTLWILNNKNFNVTPKLLVGTTFLIFSMLSLMISILSFLSRKILHINIEILSKIKLKKNNAN